MDRGCATLLVRCSVPPLALRSTVDVACHLPRPDCLLHCQHRHCDPAACLRTQPESLRRACPQTHYRSWYAALLTLPYTHLEELSAKRMRALDSGHTRGHAVEHRAPDGAVMPPLRKAAPHAVRCHPGRIHRPCCPRAGLAESRRHRPARHTSRRNLRRKV